MDNIYRSYPAQITAIRQETPDVRTFVLRFCDETVRQSFHFHPGQFVEFSVFGEGEAPFCLANSPTRGGAIECSVKKMGKVTQALHEMDVGDVVGIRGPYGNGFPVSDFRHKNLVFVAGGIGLAPLRSLINYCLDCRDEFGYITIVNGARSAKDLVFKDEYDVWQKAGDTTLTLTIDRAEEGWSGRVGVVPQVLSELNPASQGALAIVCGPPIMIKYTLPVLSKIGFSPEQMITTLEMKMKCGLGKCGRCNIGHQYICKDGPVFNGAQLEKLHYEH